MYAPLINPWPICMWPLHMQPLHTYVCDALQARGVSAAFYHAMVDPEMKTELHKRWLAGEVSVMVATVRVRALLQRAKRGVVAGTDVRTPLGAARTRSPPAGRTCGGRAARSGGA